MSTLVVEVCKIDEIEDHPNADRMKIATIKGWKVCIGFNPETNKAEFEVGERCIYFPVGSILPSKLANSPDDPDNPGRLGVKKYLKLLPKVDGVRPDGGVVAATRLRGYPSYGLVMKIDPTKGDLDWGVGSDVADFYGITKFEPPPESSEGDAERPCTSFYRYSGIEHFGNYPEAFEDNEEIVMTEKIHGKSTRLGLVLDGEEWTFMAGSHSVRRREVDANGRPSEFWMVFSENIKNLLVHLKNEFIWREPKFSIVVFGELYGSAVQDMTYGMSNGVKKFAAFDICVNGTFLDYDDKVMLFDRFEVPRTPLLYRGPYSKEIVAKFTDGNTVVCDVDKITTAFKGREGVVIQPVKERTSKVLCGHRLILKSVSVDYLSRRNGTEAH